MQKYIEKANVLIEALPYMRIFNGKSVVIKYGGSAMADEKLRKKVLEDIVLMRLVGINVVIVHGGGKHITELSEKLGIESTFRDGLRVTDEASMMVAQMVLAGLINKDIVADLSILGAKACGFSGKDGRLIEAVKKVNIDGSDYGLVGDIVNINTDLLDIMCEKNYISVVSPIAFDKNGESLNINADVAAAMIAKALQAEKIVYLTDIDGILTDKNDPKTLLNSIDTKKAEDLKEKGIITSGMIPKIDACINALNSGVKKVHIINGKVPHAIILEMFTDMGIGTEIVL